MFDFIDLLGMLSQNVLADEIWSLEFLSTQRTQPLVFGQLLSVSKDEFVYLSNQQLKSRKISTSQQQALVVAKEKKGKLWYNDYLKYD